MSPTTLSLSPKTTIQPTRVNHRIVDLDYEITIDKIVVILGVTWYAKGAIPTMSEVIVINHDELEQWADENDKLRLWMGFDRYDDISFTDRYEDISFTEYLKSEICKSDIRDFILSKNLIPENYAFAGL